MLSVALDIAEGEFSGFFMNQYENRKKTSNPENPAKFPDNAVVLVSCIYPYRFDNITNNLMKLGLKREQIIHIRPLAEKLLNVSADYFSQNGMDKKVKTLFDSIGRDISKIRY